MSAVREARASAPSVDAAESIGPGPGLPLLLLVGNPNVGKTSLFNRLA
jgi:tRNA U34 5-carboxymethylaminomethyl modifying GTPase MnmE/TrmE